jgi:hypothetical protein
MKVVVALIMGLCACNAFAWDYQQEAEAKFNKMSAQEAYKSDFRKRTMSVQMPGTSTFVSGTEVCIAGNTVRTINPVSYCVQWTGKDKDGDIRTFDNYLDANNLIKGGAAGNCSGKVQKILSTPVNYSATKCTLWSAVDDGEKKYFSSKSKAEDYGGNAVCAKYQTYNATYPTTFKVEFFRNKLEDNQYLGSHTYAVARCGGGTTPDVVAF